MSGVASDAGTGVVRTILGDIPAARLGRVDAHEHVFLRTPALPDSEFLDPGRMTTELSHVLASGIETVVDLTTIGIGRQPVQLADVSRRAGVHVVAATGFHRDAHYLAGNWVTTASSDTLLATLLTDITEGIDASDWTDPHPVPTSHRAGVVKLGASYQHISTTELRRMEAGAEAARLTGVPVVVHTEIGTAAHDVLDVIEAVGVAPERVMLAHMDRNPDPDLHAELCARGAHLVYDTVGRIKYRPDSDLLDLIETMFERGHGSRLMLGTDVGRRDSLRAYGGGPGMDVLGRSFVPRVSRRLGVLSTRLLLVDNPARLFSMSLPPEGTGNHE